MNVWMDFFVIGTLLFLSNFNC